MTYKELDLKEILESIESGIMSVEVAEREIRKWWVKKEKVINICNTILSTYDPVVVYRDKLEKKDLYNLRK